MEILNFEENPVQELTLQKLEKTVDERTTGGTPLVGIKHHDMFNRVNDILDHHGLKFEIKSMWAAHNKSRHNPGVTVFPELEEKYGEKAIQATLLRRLFAQYVITSYDTPDINSGIAVSFHQQGIQIAWGPNVKICTNLCIMSYEDTIKTYGGDDKVGTEKLFEVINSWAERFDERIESRIKLVESLKDKACNVKDVCNMLGSWTLKRVANEKFSEHASSPQILNQGQISKLAERYIMKTKVEKEPVENAYQFYNTVTDMLKPGTTDMPSIINQNVALSKFILWYYNMN